MTIDGFKAVLRFIKREDAIVVIDETLKYNEHFPLLTHINMVNSYPYIIPMLVARRLENNTNGISLGNKIGPTQLPIGHGPQWWRALQKDLWDMERMFDRKVGERGAKTKDLDDERFN